MKRLRNFGKFHVPDNSPLNLCSSPLLHKVAKAQYGQTCQALEWVEATLTRLYMGKVGTVLGGLRRMQATSAKRSKRLTTAGYILMTIGAGLTMASFAAEAIRWGVGASNRRIHSCIMSGSSAPVPGGTKPPAIRCWRCAAPCITGPWIRCLCGTNNGDGQCQNDRMLPMPGSVGWKWKADAYRHATGSSMCTSSRLEGFDER